MSLKRFHVKRQTDEYYWSENSEFITIHVSIRNVLLKDISIYTSDLYVKINVPKIKFIMVFDLKHPITIGHLKNKTTLANGQLDIRLVKDSPEVSWSELEFTGTREEKIQRRQESMARFEEWDKQKDQVHSEVKIKLDKAAIDKQMELESWERSKVKHMKEEEKRYEEDRLYQHLDIIEGLDQKLKQGYQIKEVTELKNESNQQEEVEEEKKSEGLVGETGGRFSKYNDPKKNIFGDEDCVVVGQEKTNVKKSKRREDSDDEDVEHKDHSQNIKELTGETQQNEKILNEFQSEPVRQAYPEHVYSQGRVEEINEDPVEEPIIKDEKLPSIREGGSKKIEFSEKVYPHMPARESHKKEAPFPKSKRKDPKTEEVTIDIEDRDPIWLKDKGDHFHKQHDYNAAMNAYTKSLKNDPDFLKCYLNRATTLLKMCNFEGAILDLDDIEKRVKQESEEELQDPFYSKLMARTLIKRAAAHAWLSNFDEAEADYTRALKEYKSFFTEQELAFIDSDLKKIYKRKESHALKVEGDQQYGAGNFEKSLDFYKQALEVDPTNEYALGNIGLVYLKKTDYEKCIEYTDKALSQLMFCSNYSKTGSVNKENTIFAAPIDTKLEIKFLLRRGQSYEMLKNYDQAKKDLDACVRLDRGNKTAASMLKKVQSHINDVLYVENKTEAERLFKDKKWNEALEYFEKCLKITRKASTLNNISVFVNKTACLLALDQIDTLISECNNAMRLVKNFKMKEMTKEEKQKIKNMEVILLVRKGKAYVKKKELKKAIEQFESALDIDPDNQSIQADVKKLKEIA